MKVLYFDTETTGTRPNFHEITQFAAIVEINGQIVEEVNWRCQPLKWENVDQEALDVTGVSLDELKKLDPPSIMMDNIKALFNRHINKFDKADKFTPAGHNVTFDLDFLQAFWKTHGDKYGTGSYQNWQALDSRYFANFLKIAGKLDVENIKLSTLCEYYGIELDAHDALNDIRATRKLIRMMVEMLQVEVVVQEDIPF